MITLIGFAYFVWKTLLDGRPKPHVSKFNEIHNKSVDFIKFHRFWWNLRIQILKSEIHRFRFFNTQISESKSSDFNEMQQISLRLEHGKHGKTAISYIFVPFWNKLLRVLGSPQIWIHVHSFNVHLDLHSGFYSVASDMTSFITVSTRCTTSVNLKTELKYEFLSYVLKVL